MLADLFTIVFLLAGSFFFITGTLGLLRFPDVFCRLHALTKCDNLGLGFIVIGLLLQTTNWTVAVKMIVIWALVMLASATSCHLIARSEHEKAQNGQQNDN